MCKKREREREKENKYKIRESGCFALSTHPSLILESFHSSRSPLNSVVINCPLSLSFRRQTRCSKAQKHSVISLCQSAIVFILTTNTNSGVMAKLTVSSFDTLRQAKQIRSTGTRCGIDIVEFYECVVFSRANNPPFKGATLIQPPYGRVSKQIVLRNPFDYAPSQKVLEGENKMITQDLRDCKQLFYLKIACPQYLDSSLLIPACVFIPSSSSS